MIGEKLDNYEIEAEIGRGGMGTVYKAINLSSGQEVALKVLPPELSRQPNFLLRFKREIATLRQLDHPGIVKMLDVGDKEGHYYYAMEYIDGQSLEEILDHKERLSITKAIDIAIAVAEALEYSHAKGVIHRDIKPGNILIDVGGCVKLTDFGIAKLVEATRMTDSGSIVGTVEYMSPEQAEGRPIDRRCDIYSLGVVLYRMLTGRVPFTGGTALEIMQMHRFRMPESVKELNREVTMNLSSVIERMMEKDIDKRIESAGVLIKILNTVKETLVRSEEPGMRRRGGAEPFPVEKAWVFAKWAAAAVVVAILGWMVWGIATSDPAKNLYRNGLMFKDRNLAATARSKFEEAVAKYPGSEWAQKSQEELDNYNVQRLLEESEMAWDNQQYTKARGLLTQIIQRYPGHAATAQSRLDALATVHIPTTSASEDDPELQQVLQAYNEAVVQRHALQQLERATAIYENGQVEEACMRARAIILLYDDPDVASIARARLDQWSQSAKSPGVSED